MSSAEPQQTLDGTLVGRICDRCNRSLQLAETVRLYATYYEGEGWLLRSVWCTECGDPQIGTGTLHADEVAAEVIFWFHRLVHVTIISRTVQRRSDLALLTRQRTFRLNSGT